MRRNYRTLLLLTLGICTLALLLPAFAGNDQDDARPAARPSGQEDADDAIRRMEQTRPENPPIAPQPRGATHTPPGVRVPYNPAVVGMLPGTEQPTLRREGEFIVNRRGRLVRSPDGQHAVFTFDQQRASRADPPMIILPCQLLQNMEDLVRDRGDDLSFIISGQIYTYRGANYLMPTMMRIAANAEHLRG
ncbi:MAG: hypothetical protein JJU36_14850 [Phycisphaeraceae bacterium]|nr:hypothetical protein [Phycisphaeraceae bacterium]